MINPDTWNIRKMRTYESESLNLHSDIISSNALNAIKSSVELAVSIMRAGYIIDSVNGVKDIISVDSLSYINDKIMSSRIRYIIKVIETANCELEKYILRNEMKLVSSSDENEDTICYESTPDYVVNREKGTYNRMVLLTTSEEILSYLDSDKELISLKYAYIETEEQMRKLV